MSGSFTYVMSGCLASLGACLRALETSPVYEEMPPDLRFVAELVLDELASNTLKYGGIDCREIVFQLEFDGDSMRITLTDDAKPFNPWQDAAAVADPPGTDTQDIAVGGRGVHMLKQATDSQHYERRDGRNINTVTRRSRGPVAHAAA